MDNAVAPLDLGLICVTFYVPMKALGMGRLSFAHKKLLNVIMSVRTERELVKAVTVVVL